MKTHIKIFAVLLSVIMLAVSLPLNAFAAAPFAPEEKPPNTDKLTYDYVESSDGYESGRVSQVVSEIRKSSTSSVISTTTNNYTYDANGNITQITNVSGRQMKVYTDQPCVQFYSGNFLNNEKYPFKNGCPQRPQMALCLETQKMPDSINHENFTSVVLDVGETYTHKTVYEFSVI